MTWEFLRTSLPLCIQMIVNNGIYMINVIFAGRFNDETKLAGVGLGTTINHVLGLCIIMGMSNAMDTLIS